MFLSGDCNVGVSKYEKNSPTNESLDSFSSSVLLPYIIQPAGVISNSKTIIDYIFSNIISTDIISGNITATISDILSQLLIAPVIFGNFFSNRCNYFERGWGNLDYENFILRYFSVGRKNIINLQKIYLIQSMIYLKYMPPVKRLKNINVNSKKTMN